VGALKKTPDGPVIYDENRCIGCRYCFVACPYGIPRYQWRYKHPLVRKCNFCAELNAKGEQPACAEICPTGATKFGEREELLAFAKERIKANPAWYFHNVFGESEAGGSSVLFITNPDIAKKGIIYPATKEPLPELTEAFIESVPFVGISVGAFLCGVWWLRKRRKQVAKAESFKEEKG